MNTPNKLTILRIVLTPIFLLLFILDFPYHYLAALIVFVGASITDYIDGNIARKQGLVTDFGKFLDPLADKMLTTAAFLGFIEMGIGYGIVYITFIVLVREFLITSLRLVAGNNGTVIAANIWGKAKTVSQMVAIIVTIVALFVITQNIIPVPCSIHTPIIIFCSVLLWISALLTVISGITYFMQNKGFVDINK